MRTVEPLNLKEPTRQDRYRAFKAEHGLTDQDIGERMVPPVSGQFVHVLFTGARDMPPARYEQLLAMGVPEEIVPTPNSKRKRCPTGEGELSKLRQKVRELESQLKSAQAA